MFFTQSKAELQAKLSQRRTCTWKPRSKNYYCKHFDSTSDCLVDSCNGFVITKPGHYYLGCNVVINNSEAAIVILASNVTLDLRGFKLATTTSTVGILLGDVKDVTIKNGTLENFSVYGINLVSNYSNVTLEDLVFDKVGGVGDENGSVVIADITSTPVQTKENIFIRNCIIRNSQARVPGALIDGLLLQDVNGIYISDLKINNCDLVNGVEIRRSVGSVEDVNIFNNTLSSGVAMINNDLSVKNIAIAENKFRVKIKDETQLTAMRVFFAGNMQIENCQVINNDIEADAFGVLGILLDDGQIIVKNCSFLRNTNTGRIVGIAARYERSRLKLNNVEFTYNSGNNITALLFSVFETDEGQTPFATSSVISIQQVNSALNQASNDYSFLNSQLTTNPVEPLSVQLENCTSKNNKNALISLDLSNFNKSLVRDCLVEGENTAYLNQGQNNVFERNLAQDCVVGFENKSNGVFVANQAFFCATPYLGVSNTLVYTDPAVTATSNVFS